MAVSEKQLLHDVARFYDVRTSYLDFFGKIKNSPAEAVLAVLKLLGAPVERMGDLADARRACRVTLWQRGIDPVLIAWDGASPVLKLRVPRAIAHLPCRYRIETEDGERLEGLCAESGAQQALEHDVEGQPYVARRLKISAQVPFGYHRLQVQVGEKVYNCQLISAPASAYSPNPDVKQWGIFSPVYALRSDDGWGAGDFSDLEKLIDFAGAAGAQIVGTLPLLAAFLDEPFEPSPYAPVSRLFWNEFFLQPERISDFAQYPGTSDRINSQVFQDELDKLRGAPLVDYRAVMALKRHALEALLPCLTAQRQQEFQSFIDSDPLAQDYAAFRAKTEIERKPWRQWPEPCRSGKLTESDYEPARKRYHLYVQWLAHQQMQTIADKTRATGLMLYLDFPLGVNRDGFDVWRQRDVFALAASGGAPPDQYFSKGQSWGFPPLHPGGLRRQAYRYYIESVRRHLRYCSMLRIDHVMGLHRLYWIPEGFDATAGVYVRYPAQDFYAVLTLESHRHRARIVGENLGTIPAELNPLMQRRKIYGMYIGEFVGSDVGKEMREISPTTVASLNTHDTAPFAGFWNGADIRDREELGLLTGDEVAREQESRAQQRAALIGYLQSNGWLGESTDPAAVVKAWLGCLAASNAEVLLINLEDLWLEELPQNVPGTYEERPNWRRKEKQSLTTMRRDPTILDILKFVDQVRRQGVKASDV